MPRLTYTDAIRTTLKELLTEDERVFLMGEDIGLYQGVFKATKGLVQEFGKERIIDTPISEASFVGVGLGAALVGLRPIVEIMFVDFTLLIMDQLCNQAAKLRYMSGGELEVPLVVRTNIGTRGGAAAQHSQSLHALFTHFPGLKIALPASPADARGLLFTAVMDPNPVLFIENKQLYFLSGEVPEEKYYIPFGRAKVVREGSDLTLVATSFMVEQARKAADVLSAEDGIEVEIIDPRTMYPLDIETIVDSLMKTTRVLIVDEGVETGGFAQQIAARVGQSGFDYLDAPIGILASPDISIPYSPPLERKTTILPEDIVTKVREDLT
jgi:pyruvate dehydrogenase E1 component beta subunit